MIQRYDMGGRGCKPQPCEDGKWVRWDSVQEFIPTNLSSQASTGSIVDAITDLIAAVVEQKKERISDDYGGCPEYMEVRRCQEALAAMLENKKG